MQPLAHMLPLNTNQQCTHKSSGEYVPHFKQIKDSTILRAPISPEIPYVGSSHFKNITDDVHEIIMQQIIITSVLKQY